MIWRFSFSKKLFLFCAFFICLFCLLGKWQLHRYYYKKTLLSTYEHGLHAAPIPLSHLSNYSQFQAVSVKGEYLNALTVFLSNRYYQGQYGVEVLTPFKIEGEQKWLLVNRGWIKDNNNQEVILNKVEGPQQITGYIKWVDEYQFILGENVLKQIPHIIMQKIDLTMLSKLTRHAFYPFILRLNPAQSHGFIRDWTIATVPPQRHLAYAIQWFAMAIVVLIAFIVAVRKK